MDNVEHVPAAYGWEGTFDMMLFQPVAKPVVVYPNGADPMTIWERVSEWRPKEGYNVYAKPLELGKPEYGVFEMTPWEDMWDDVARYGVWVALYNAWYHVKHINDKEDEG